MPLAVFLYNLSIAVFLTRLFFNWKEFEVSSLYFNDISFAENKLVVNLNVPLGDPLKPTRVKDPDTREIILMGKIRDDIENV